MELNEVIPDALTEIAGALDEIKRMLRERGLELPAARDIAELERKK